MIRLTFNVVEEPRDNIYRCLLRAAMEQTSVAYLVLRDSVDIDVRARDCLMKLKSALKSENVVSEWPGTQLLTGSARILTFEASPTLPELLASCADGLYDWLQPGLPEDLGFLRADGSVWLASTAHERDAWLELDSGELARLVRMCPEIERRIEKSGSQLS